jgi:hypothetical protein
VEVFTLGKAEAAPAPIAATQFSPITPIHQEAPPAEAYAPGPPQYYPAYYPQQPGYPAYGGYPPPYPQPRYIPIPVYYPSPRTAVATLPPRQSMPAEQEAPPEFYAPIPKLDEWQSASNESLEMPSWRGPVSKPAQTQVPVPSFIPRKILDRLQLDAWAMYRGTPGTGSLASNGTLGGSQVGGRLTYALNPALGASLRWSSPIGSVRGGEAAAGIRWKPIASIPVAITAERRQAVGRYSTGRSDFALFAEGGVYERPIGWNLMLDGYAQAGVVGLQTRDLFADGGFAVSRPVWGRFSAGLGAWGGYQPGLYRIDAGPRVSMRLRQNVSVHLDWRQRLAGTAEPASGPALTVGANF